MTHALRECAYAQKFLPLHQQSGVLNKKKISLKLEENKSETTLEHLIIFTCSLVRISKRIQRTAGCIEFPAAIDGMIVPSVSRSWLHVLC